MDEEKKEEVVSKEEVVETPAEVKEEIKVEETKAEEVKAEEPKTEEVKTEKATVETKTEAKKEVKDEQPKVENISSKKGKGNKLPLVLGIVAILLLAIAGIAFYLFNNSSSADKIFKGYIDAYKDIVVQSEGIDGAKVIKAGSTLDVDLKLTDGLIDKDLLDLINDINLDMDMQVDVEKNQIAYLVTANKNEDKILDVEAYIADSKMYVKLNELLDKVLYTEVEDAEDLNINYSALTENEKVVIVKFVDAINNSLKPEYFTQEKIEKEKENVLTLDDAKIKAIITSIVSELKNDAEFVAAASKLSDVTEDELKSSFDTIISETNSEEILPEGQQIHISLFTKGMKNELTRVEIKLRDKETVAMNISMNVVSNEEVSYQVSIGEQTITGSFIYKEKSKEEADMTFTLKYAEYIDAKIMMTSTYSIDKTNNIVLPDFSSAVDFDKLTEEDTNEILNNAKNNKALMDVINVFSSMVEDSMGSLDMEDEDLDFDLEDDEEDEEDKDLTSKDDEEEDKDSTSKDDEEDEEDKDSTSKNDEEDETDTIDSDNVVKNDKYKVTFKLPKNYILDEEYSSERYKYFDYDSKKDEIEVYLKIAYDTAEEYFDSFDKYDYEYKLNDDFYSNVKKTEITEMEIGENTIKYVELTYDAGTSSEYEEIFAIYEIDEDYAYIVEIEARNTSISNSLLKSFMDITVEE